MKAKTLIIALCALCLASCGKTDKIEHVVWIGIDGLSSEGFEKGDMPYIKSLLPEASYTVKKRSVLPSSSAVNWATMFNGACPELHGYTTWGSKTPDLPSRVTLKNNTFPTFFQLYRDKYPDAEMGCMYDWDGIKYLIDTLSFDFYSTPTTGEFADIKGLTDEACNYISSKDPDITLVVFDNPDHEGHGIGWCSDAYMEALTKLDKAVETIFKAAEEAGFTRENSVFVVTADHGGIGQGHGGKTMNEMETPFIILGKGIKKGYCFDDISMMQFDVASTIGQLFQLEQPQVWIGRPMPVCEEK